jgi:hypothetical protein
MMFFEPMCVVCKEHREEIMSYSKIDGGTTTKCCCKECSEKTNDKWIENGWEKVITLK